MTEHTMQIDGLTRTYRLYVPAGLVNPGLVFALHGSGQAPGYGGLRFLADSWVKEAERTKAFAVVTPLGDAPTKWSWGSVDPTNPNDLHFFEAIADAVVPPLGIDPARIYCVGFSGGANLTYRIGRDMSDTFGGIATASGWIAPPALGGADYYPIPGVTRRLPFWALHGGRDEPNDMQDAVAAWARHNGATVPGVCPAVQLPTGPYWGWVNSQTGDRAQGHIEDRRPHQWPRWAPPYIWAFWTSCP